MGRVKERLQGANRRYPVDLSAIVSGLTASTLSLCRELLPLGVLEGEEYRIGSPRGEAGRSMAVNIKSGTWADFTNYKKGARDTCGDVLDLVATVRFGGNKGDAVKWALSWLGLDGKDPARLRETRRREEHHSVAAGDPDADQAKRKAAAWRVWLHGQEKLAGTPVEGYLLGRGIDLAELGRQPRALHYVPELWNAESQRKWPAMVAAIFNREGEFLAVHRTWLEVQRDGTVRKAPLRDAKMTLGRYRGGFIQLWRGGSGKGLKEAPEGDSAIIAEGIEDGLTCALVAPEFRVLAAVSLSNMAAMILPNAIRQIVIAGQNDGWHDDNQAKAKAAAIGLDNAIRHFAGQGREVMLFRPRAGKDINDLLNGKN